MIIQRNILGFFFRLREHFKKNHFFCSWIAYFYCLLESLTFIRQFSLRSKKIAHEHSLHLCLPLSRKDEERVFIPADKGKVMVAMDKTIEKGGENCYEFKMKKVLEDMKAKPSIRAGKDLDY